MGMQLLFCAHLHGLEVPERLKDDQRMVLQLAPKLIDGMMSMAYLKVCVFPYNNVARGRSRGRGG